MKAADLKKGMLLTSIHKDSLITQSMTSNTGLSIVRTKLTKKLPQFVYDEVKYMLYVGDRAELGFEKNLWGQRYVLANGKMMIVNNNSWQYITYVNNCNYLI